MAQTGEVLHKDSLGKAAFHGPHHLLQAHSGHALAGTHILRSACDSVFSAVCFIQQVLHLPKQYLQMLVAAAAVQPHGAVCIWKTHRASPPFLLVDGFGDSGSENAEASLA